MASKRRIAALSVIQRIKEHELDEHAARMGIVRQHQAAIENELENLQNRVDTEAHISSPEAAPFLAGFLRAIETRRTFLLEELKSLERSAAEIEEHLFDAFTEARTNETVLDKTRYESRKQDEMAEQAALEEVARNRYLRQMTRKT